MALSTRLVRICSTAARSAADAQRRRQLLRRARCFFGSARLTAASPSTASTERCTGDRFDARACSRPRGARCRAGRAVRRESRWAWRIRMSRNELRASGSSAAPAASVSATPTIAATGVRSSCEALATKSRRRRSRRLGSVTSMSTTTAWRAARSPSGSHGRQQRAPGELHLARDRLSRGERRFDGVAQLGHARRVADGAPLGVAAEADRAREGRIGDGDDAVLHQRHALGHAVEDGAQLVPLAAQLLDARGQLVAQRIERVDQIAELVVAGLGQRHLEVAVAHRARGARHRQNRPRQPARERACRGAAPASAPSGPPATPRSARARRWRRPGRATARAQQDRFAAAHRHRDVEQARGSTVPSGARLRRRGRPAPLCHLGARGVVLERRRARSPVRRCRPSTAPVAIAMTVMRAPPAPTQRRHPAGDVGRHARASSSAASARASRVNESRSTSRTLVADPAVEHERRRHQHRDDHAEKGHQQALLNALTRHCLRGNAATGLVAMAPARSHKIVTIESASIVTMLPLKGPPKEGPMFGRFCLARPASSTSSSSTPR